MRASNPSTVYLITHIAATDGCISQVPVRAPPLDRPAADRLNVAVALQDEPSAQASALDIWIEQERQLISHYEARATRAEASAAAAITAVLALAALTATAVETDSDVDKTYALLIVGVLALVCVLALGVRTFAGLRRSRTSLVSSGSDKFDEALRNLRNCDSTNPDPINVRQRILELCIARATDAHRTAVSKDRAAALASAALAVALIAILALRLLTA
jgi:hypothetical protein